MPQRTAHRSRPRSLARQDDRLHERRWRLITMAVLVAIALLSGSASQRVARLIGLQQEAGSLLSGSGNRSLVAELAKQRAAETAK